MLPWSLNAMLPCLKSQRVDEGVPSKKSKWAVAVCAWLKTFTWEVILGSENTKFWRRAPLLKAEVTLFRCSDQVLKISKEGELYLSGPLAPVFSSFCGKQFCLHVPLKPPLPHLCILCCESHHFALRSAFAK